MQTADHHKVLEFFWDRTPAREAWIAVRSVATLQQRLAVYETACALRLHALDAGRYPASLTELVPKQLSPDLLGPAGPAQFTYRPEGDGCRITWRSWERQDEGLRQIGDEQEIAIGVPPTPRDELKKCFH